MKDMGSGLLRRISGLVTHITLKCDASHKRRRGSRNPYSETGGAVTAARKIFSQFGNEI